MSTVRKRVYMEYDSSHRETAITEARPELHSGLGQLQRQRKTLSKYKGKQKIKMR